MFANLIIILESLGEVILNMEGSGELVAALGPHGFVLSVVEGVEGEMLNFGVIFLEEEMVGEVVQHHRVGGVDRVRFRQFPDTLLDGEALLCVQVEDGLTDESANAVGVEFLGPFERHPSLGLVPEFVVA